MANKRVHVGAVGDETSAQASATDESTDKRLSFEAMHKHYEAAADKTLIFSYLMRIWPICDQRRVTGPKGHINIDKIPGVFTREYILAKHGNGAYQISFHDDSRPRAKRRVGVLNFDIQEPGAVPLCDPRAVLWNDPRNAQYVEALRAAGALPPEAHAEMGTAAAAAAGAVATAAAAPVRSLTAQVSELMEVQQMLGVGQRSGGGSDLNQAVLLPLFNSMAQTNIALMERLQQASAAPPPAARAGGLGDLREMIGLLVSLGWAPPGGVPAAAVAAAAGAPVEAPAESALGTLMSGLGSIASIVKDAREMFFAMRGAPVPVAGDDGGASVETLPAAPSAAAETDERGAMMQKVQTFGQFALTAFLEGRTAAEFVESANALPDGAELIGMAREFGVGKLKQMLSFVPGLEDRLKGEGKSMDDAKRWLDQVFQVLKKGGRK